MARSWTMASAICSVQRISVSKSGIRPVEPNADLRRHAQRFLELRRGLEQIEYFCKGTVLKRMMKCGSPVRLCLRRHQAPRSVLRAYLQSQRQDGQCQAFTASRVCVKFVG